MGASMRNGRTRLALVAVGIVTALGLSGCSQTGSTAATVDGTVIDVATVQTATEQLSSISTLDQATVLTWLIEAPTMLSVGASYGVSASEDDARDLYKTTLESSTDDTSGAATASELSTATLTALRFYLVANSLSSTSSTLSTEDLEAATAEIVAGLADLDVETNPRYGTFSVTNAAIVPASPYWLVTTGTDAA